MVKWNWSTGGIFRSLVLCVYFKKQQVFQLNILLSSTGSFISIEIHRLLMPQRYFKYDYNLHGNWKLISNYYLLTKWLIWKISKEETFFLHLSPSKRWVVFEQNYFNSSTCDTGFWVCILIQFIYYVNFVNSSPNFQRALHQPFWDLDLDDQLG